jgi:hypothetical protein
MPWWSAEAATQTFPDYWQKYVDPRNPCFSIRFFQISTFCLDMIKGIFLGSLYA